MIARRKVSRVGLAVLAVTACVELLLRAQMPELGSNEPAHDVLFLTPDRAAGWKHPKNFQYLWTGRNPYCIEFRVAVTTNSFGFRDRAWTVEKPPDTIRIAVLGDSFIEAIQVPLERTATRLLEGALVQRFPGKSFETMNFGVSNYSVGQYLMVYEEYVRPFKPDYVVALAGYLNFNRTTEQALSSYLQDFYALSVRPSYSVDEHGHLVVIPAQEYDQYVASVQKLLDSQYGEDRTRPVYPIRSPLYLTRWFMRTLWRFVPMALGVRLWRSSEFADVPLNYRILEELHRRVESDGGTLLFADAFEHLEPHGRPRGSDVLAPQNETFLTSIGARYVNVSPALGRASSNPRFECDMHFSDAGNQALADALFEWFATELPARQMAGF